MIEEEIPIGVEVHSMNGSYGRSLYIILDPIQEKATHLVVQEKEFPQTQRLIPIHMVQVTSPQQINLAATTAKLKELEPFIETEFIPSKPILFWPYVEPETEFMILEHEKIPIGEIAARRGTRVLASDGPIGYIDELIIDRKDSKITHLVLREGHLWGQKEISIPVTQIQSMDQDTVYLKLSKREVETLPIIRIKRFRPW